MNRFQLNRYFQFMSFWARTSNIKNFPKNLSSLIDENPSIIQIKNDYEKINIFNNHPSYIIFCLGYNPNVSCKKE